MMMMMIEEEGGRHSIGNGHWCVPVIGDSRWMDGWMDRYNWACEWWIVLSQLPWSSFFLLLFLNHTRSVWEGERKGGRGRSLSLSLLLLSHFVVRVALIVVKKQEVKLPYEHDLNSVDDWKRQGSRRGEENTLWIQRSCQIIWRGMLSKKMRYDVCGL